MTIEPLSPPYTTTSNNGHSHYSQAIQRTYDLPGPLNPTAKPLRQTAGEVMAYFKALNYDVSTLQYVVQIPTITSGTHFTD